MSARDKAIAIVRQLRQAGFEAYLAGGCVRDMLLHKEAKDYDVATNARPEEIQRLFPHTIPVGAQFGVIIVLLEDQPIEVASFRHDGPYLDGRHPSEVRFGTLEEDVRRRDFTVNGMVYDPIDDRVIDLVEGRKDLAARIIRAIGNPRHRFEEDRLRMLRAVRFAASLNFTIDAATLAAIPPLASTLTQISWERIGDEITRILTEGQARRGFELLDESGLLAVVLPEANAIKRYLREDGMDELLELARIDALSSNGDLQYYGFCRARLGEMQDEVIRPAPVLRGGDLIELGFKPGPFFSQILRQVEDAQLGGELSSREAALEWVKTNFAN